MATTRARLLDGDSLRSRRLGLRLTQAGLAAALGVTPTTVARWERGEQRIGNPERVALALERIDTSARNRTNLPTLVSSFVGRELEIASVADELQSRRLLTLTGVGGVGKARLALEVARRTLPRYGDGAWLVELASLTEPSLVPQIVAAAVGVAEQQGVDMLDTLLDALQDRALLLVFDNCEHLIESCARVIARLLHACSELQVLATSREPLRLEGECTWSVEPMGAEAALLFVDRARGARPDLMLDAANAATVDTICRRLDGMPLAIELAAARLRVLTLEELATRLDDQMAVLVGGQRVVQPRHQTLRAALEWSHALLSPAEQLLFERLSVFTGGWTLAAAEAVCADEGVPSNAILDVLTRLVEKSLIGNVLDGGRFRALEPVRQFAQQRLLSKGELAYWRDRHASYFLDLTERSEPDSWGPEAAAWCARLGAELHNYRAALRWLIETRQVELAQRMGASYARFWKTGNYMKESLAWMAELLVLPGGDAPTRPRARVLAAAGEMLSHVGNLAEGEVLLYEALAICRDLGETRALVSVMWLLAQDLVWSGDPDKGRILAEEGLAISRAAGFDADEGHCLWVLAGAADSLGDSASACLLAQQSVDVHQRIGYDRGMAIAKENLGRALYHLGELGPARDALEQAALHFRVAAFPFGVAWTMTTLGWVAADQRDFTYARACLVHAVELFRELGASARYAEVVMAFAQLACAEGHFYRALRLAAAAHAQQERTPLPHMPDGFPRLEPRLQRARRALGDTDAAFAWSEGRGLSIDDALTEAVASVRPLARSTRTSALTRREHEVATLVARGFSNREIAEQLIISERTAETHLERIYTKLDLHSRVQLATWLSTTSGQRLVRS